MGWCFVKKGRYIVSILSSLGLKAERREVGTSAVANETN